jgi:PAS domain S-box-containing protein
VKGVACATHRCYLPAAETSPCIGYKHARGSARAAEHTPPGLGDNTPLDLEITSMLRMPASAFEDDARGLINTRMALRLLWVGVAVCGIGGVASMLQPYHITTAARVVLVGVQMLLALLCAVGTQGVHALPARVLVLTASWAGVIAATLAALSIGHGAHSLDLSFCPLIVCMVAVLAGTRQAFVMAMACALIVAGLAWGEADGWLPGAAALAQSPLSHPLIAHGLLLMAGFTIGAIMLRLSNASFRSAQEREERFRGLLATAADHYWELDESLRLSRADAAATLTASALFKRQMMRPLVEAIEVHAHQAATQSSSLDDLREHRPFSGLRGSLRDAAGQLVHLEFSGHPRTKDDGRFAGYWGVARDITEQVRAEAQLRRSESMLSTLFTATPDCLALTELASGRFLMVNQALLDTFGYLRDEVIGRTSLELGIWDSPGDRAPLLQAMREQGTLTSVRTTFRTRSGVRIHMLMSATICGIDGVDTVVVNARDVTADERTRQEHAAIFQRASIGIAFTREHRIASANPCFERLFGWQAGALAGQPMSAIWPDLAAAGEPSALQTMLPPNEPVVIERQMTRRDGSRFWCHLRADALAGDAALGGGTIWFAEDMTDRHRAEQDIAAARDAAEAASRAKSAFLANTSHEIRTPLNGLLGLVRLAMRDGIAEAQRKTYMTHILESAEGLAATLSDILDLSKIEAGKLGIDAAPFSLHDALDSVCRANLPIAQARGLTLQLTVDAALPVAVVGDANRIRQIIGNFVSNAIKFTERGQVRIHASPQPGPLVRLAVLDTGIGIDAQTQPRLFQPFSQADQSTTRRYGGTGLGLSICRELARLMGGQVGLSSSLGVGSEFWVELPLPAVHWADIRPVVAAEADDIRVLQGARVLIGEDNAVNMMIASGLLQQWGVQVGQAVDGVAVVEAALQADRDGMPFDAVLMDLQMPRLSGHAAARELRERLGERAPPIIALTAAALVSERDEALRAGMCEFLTKPVNTERLRSVLAHCVGRGRG